jgi:hypothetical protein
MINVKQEFQFPFPLMRYYFQGYGYDILVSITVLLLKIGSCNETLLCCGLINFVVDTYAN